VIQLSALHYIARILVILAHLVGLVVAIILLSRKKGTATVLATVAFALLVLLDIGQIAEMAFLRRLLSQAVRSARTIPWLTGGLNCCCSLLDLGGIGCLIAALWHALGGPKAGEEAEVEIEEEAASEEATFAD